MREKLSQENREFIEGLASSQREVLRMMLGERRWTGRYFERADLAKRVEEIAEGVNSLAVTLYRLAEDDGDTKVMELLKNGFSLKSGEDNAREKGSTGRTRLRPIESEIFSSDAEGEESAYGAYNPTERVRLRPPFEPRSDSNPETVKKLFENLQKNDSR